MIRTHIRNRNMKSRMQIMMMMLIIIANKNSNKRQRNDITASRSEDPKYCICEKRFESVGMTS